MFALIRPESRHSRRKNSERSSDETRMSSQKQTTPPQKAVKGRGPNHFTTVTKETAVKEKPIKIVLRRLPPQMTWEDLEIQLAPIPTYTYHRFCKADRRLRQNAFARVYFAFCSRQDAIKFRDRFNGYVFMDKDGCESTGVVELAPNHNIPATSRSQAKQNDFKCGTIQNDPDFKSFAAEYCKPQVKKKVDFEAIINAVDERDRHAKDGSIKETPLTSFIIQRTIDRIRRIADKKRARDEKFGSGRPKARGRFAEPKKGPAPETCGDRDKKPGSAAPQNDKKPKPAEKDKPRAEPNPEGNRRERRAAAALERRQKRAAAQAAKKPTAGPKSGPGNAEKGPSKDIVIPCGRNEKGEPKRTLVFKPASNRDGNTSSSKTSPNQPGGSSSTPSSSGPNRPGSNVTNTQEKRERPTPSGRVIRNKDRPERALYQPGQRRRGGGAPPP
uniref:Smg4_UPF3 domain-containing protein n=1 Tax=Steinernema glaseri TaxID=37863 RepID=A0A1I7YMW7_9BILA